MNCEYYTGVDARLEVPIMLTPTPDLVDHRDSDILIADDVADTGHTLKLVYDYLPATRVRSVRIAVLNEQPWSTVNCRLGMAPVTEQMDSTSRWSTEPAIVTDDQARA